MKGKIFHLNLMRELSKVAEIGKWSRKQTSVVKLDLNFTGNFSHFTTTRIYLFWEIIKINLKLFYCNQR